MSRANELVHTVESALDSSNWTLPYSVANIRGLVGPDFKQFLHTVVAAPLVKRYLEIGAWEGSSTISALYENINKLDKHWIVDNWSQSFLGQPPGAPKEGFTRNWNAHITQPPNLIDADSFAINPSDYGMSNIDVYFYDGGHTEEQQKKALTHYIDCMAPQFIYIVDDWKWERVRKGSTQGITELGLKVLWSKEITTEGPGLSPAVPLWPGHSGTEGWSNGTGIFVLERSV